MTENLNRITLQNILLNPVSGNSEGLYFTGSGHSLNSEGMKIVNGGFLDFYSYFNLISWKKWSDYTGVDSLSLRLELQGKCEIVISSRQITGEQKDPFSTFVEGDGITIINIPSHLLYGQLSFKIIPAVDALLISGDWISTDMPYTQNINMAAVICTYKRDDYLFRNLELLKNNLADGFEIIVIDNASLLATGSITAYGPEFHLYHNPNTGGSGGFTQGIMKAFSSYSRFSHVLLMNDDIKLEPDTIRRSISLLRHLKPEYRDHFVSGSLLLLDEPCKMFESTASWNGFRVKSYKRDLDLIDPIGLEQLDKEDSSRNQYSAWWYCAFPLSNDIREDLPFPFFLYGDDIDYSFRHAKGFLTLNGIGVWHESFYKKFNPYFKSYFFSRNTLILNSLHPSRFSFFHSLVNSWAHFYTQLFVHDYQSVKFVIMAVEDFLEGAEYVTALDEAEHLKKYNSSGDFRIMSEEELKGSFPISSNFNRFKSPGYFFHKKLVLYENDSREAVICIRSWEKVLSFLGKGLVLFIRFVFTYNKAGRSYRQIKRDRSFWTQRLYSRKEINTDGLETV